MFPTLAVLSLIGAVISFYAFLVERASRDKKNYKASCDFSKNISCTRAFQSKYGKLFKFSNSTGGLAYYAIVLILLYNNQLQVIFYLSVLALIGSLYLAYISYVKMKNFCIVCTAIYVINVLIFLQATHT